MHINIIGMGVVGSALYNQLKHTNIKIYTADIKHGTTIEQLNFDNSITFICINVDNDYSEKTQNISHLINMLKYIKTQSNNVKIVLKSTVLPSNIKKIKNVVPSIIYSPEFLTEHDAYDTMLNFTTIILGCDDVTKSSQIEFIYKKINDNYKYIYCTPEEAAQLKYVRNALGAIKVLFWHNLSSFCNVRKISKMLEKMEIDNPQGLMSQLNADGSPGFGGKCFPKDINALYFETQNNFFNSIIKLNDSIRNTNNK